MKKLLLALAMVCGITLALNAAPEARIQRYDSNGRPVPMGVLPTGDSYGFKAGLFGANAVAYRWDWTIVEPNGNVYTTATSPSLPFYYYFAMGGSYVVRVTVWFIDVNGNKGSVTSAPDYVEVMGGVL